MSNETSWDFKNIEHVSQVTAEDVAVMQAFLNDGNRGAAYLYYYQLTGSTQALIQAQITTGSGTFGGAALYGNYLAKIESGGAYNLTLEDFSARILQAKDQ